LFIFILYSTWFYFSIVVLGKGEIVMKKLMSTMVAAVMCITVTGQGIMPAGMSGTRGQMMAKRAAIVTAQRNAAVQLGKHNIRFVVQSVVFDGNRCTVSGLAE
jgi:hypothetical protein